MTTLDQAEADLRHAAEQAEQLRRLLAVQRADEEFRITRFEIVAGLVVIALVLVGSYFKPGPWFA